MNYMLFLVIIFISSFQNTEKSDLKITVTNIKSLKGNIEIGIFNNAKSFPEKGKEYRTYSKSVTKDSTVFILQDLIKGDYAIAIYHDINSDKKCNLNFMGIPIEPYGFSNNFKPRLSKPSFNNCKIKVDKDSAIMIKLIH